MFFLNPTYLWALLGLVVPIAIHLWSRKEGKTIKIGSIQLLKESDPRQTSNIKINEIWLLLLRILILTILVLILAEPQIKTKAENVPVTYILEPSLVNSEEISAITDTLETFRLLKPGFPEYSESEIIAEEVIPNYWQLAREMETIPADSIVVFSKSYLQGFQGKRPEIAKNITWINVNSGEEYSKVLKAVNKNDEIELFSMISDDGHLNFKKETFSEDNQQKDSVQVNEKWLPITQQTPIQIQISYSDSLETEMRYIRSAFTAISKYLDRPVNLEITLSKDSIKTNNQDALVWLDPENPPDTNVKQLLFRPDSLAKNILEAESNNIYHFTKALNSENIIEDHLTEELLDFLELNKSLETEINKNDRRILDISQLQLGKINENSKEYTQLLEISKWLWILLFLLLIGERGLSFYRKQ